MNRPDDVSSHYSMGDLGDRILQALTAAGKDIDNLAVDDLAPVDEFHIRGRMATEELAQWAEIKATDLILDVGCGLGGTARYLGHTTGSRVVGIDLTEEYCQVAEMLSERVGLAESTSFRQASALEMPFADAHFDVVWTEHVQMNIADKPGFYNEIARVLKPGGQLVFHDIFAGPQTDLEFPVPWAVTPSISHLVAVDDLRPLLKEAGFEEVRWEDKTSESAAFFSDVMKRVGNDGWMPVGLHLLMGDDAPTKFGNLLSNLENDRVHVVQAVMKRSG
jgi:ubiquinone/menaquinone biosynthesis C-methylase UbiE